MEDIYANLREDSKINRLRYFYRESQRINRAPLSREQKEEGLAKLADLPDIPPSSFSC